VVTYHSTRGSTESLSFDEVILSGVAKDKGLYLPDSVTLENLSHLTQEDLSYEDFVKTIFISLDKNSAKYVEDIPIYPGFEKSPEPVLKEIEENKYVMELFHGPTKSFKDYALQPLGAIANRRLNELDKRGLVLVATSGDTGSAAIQAVKDSENIDIVVLHPNKKVSEYQRRQMTEVIKSNVLNIAIDGSYDDCQKIVKELLQKNSFENQVISLNSINWLRVMGQTAYYVWLTKQFSSPVNIAIPSGNFGNAYSAWFGRNNGLPINEIFCASNTNDVLTRFIHNGCLEPKETTQTFAPSMDIQIPSSLERLIYDLQGDTTEFYTSLQHEGRAELDAESLLKLQHIFSSASYDNNMILDEIEKFYKKFQFIIDPHTATALSDNVNFGSGLPVVGIATASPEKFENVIKRVIPEYHSIESPNEEHFLVLDSEVSLVENTINEYF
jgi:threonine synthase